MGIEKDSEKREINRRIKMIEQNIKDSTEIYNAGNITYEQMERLRKEANNRIKELNQGKL